MLVDGGRQGARFAKWRAALKVGQGMPSQHALALNSQQLAQYAAICQVGGESPDAQLGLKVGRCR